MSAPHDHPEFEALLQRVCDGTLDDDQQRRLGELLEDDALRQHYVRIMMTHQIMDTCLSDAAGPIPLETPSVIREVYEETSDRDVSKRSAWRWSAAAAVLIAAGVIIGLLTNASNRPAEPFHAKRANVEIVATVIDATDAEWADPADTAFLVAGHELEHSSLRLRAGSAQLAMANGAVIKMLGPTELRVDGEDRCTLEYGRVLAYVSPATDGLTVHTPAGRVVDRGTTFGVTVHRDGRVETHVFDGRVEVFDAERSIGVVTEGEAFRWGGAAVTKMPANGRTFGLGGVSNGVAHAAGSITMLDRAPRDVLEASEQKLIGFVEHVGIRLDAPTDVTRLSRNGPLEVIPFESQAALDVYVFALRNNNADADPRPEGLRRTGTVRFNGRVVAVMAESASLASGHATFALPETAYPLFDKPNVGIEVYGKESWSDKVGLSDEGRTLHLDLGVTPEGVDMIRVLVEPAR